MYPSAPCRKHHGRHQAGHAVRLCMEVHYVQFALRCAPLSRRVSAGRVLLLHVGRAQQMQIRTYPWNASGQARLTDSNMQVNITSGERPRRPPCGLSCPGGVASSWPVMWGTICGTPSNMWPKSVRTWNASAGIPTHVTSGERPTRASGDARLLETEGTFFAPLLSCLPDRLGSLNRIHYIDRLTRNILPWVTTNQRAACRNARPTGSLGLKFGGTAVQHIMSSAC
jgi:hypothetical protein